jgi:hypothetical protein
MTWRFSEKALLSCRGCGGMTWLLYVLALSAAAGCSHLLPYGAGCFFAALNTLHGHFRLELDFKFAVIGRFPQGFEAGFISSFVEEAGSAPTDKLVFVAERLDHRTDCCRIAYIRQGIACRPPHRGRAVTQGGEQMRQRFGGAQVAEVNDSKPADGSIVVLESIRQQRDSLRFRRIAFKRGITRLPFCRRELLPYLRKR